VLRRRLITLATLLVAGATALLAVPGLRVAASRAGHIGPGWLVGAVALELASCVSFLAIFRRFFIELPGPLARRLAWVEMGSGALLPGGGIGSLAAGALLLRRQGMSTRRIVEKSSGLFFLTSGTNVVALEGGALLLALGFGSGPHGLLAWGVPAMIGLVGATAVIAIPHTRWHRSGRSKRLRYVVDGISQAEQELLRPDWRLLGALGYLGFDIAVLGVTCAAVGYPIGIPALVLAYIIGYAANTLPVPGGIGVLEGGLVGALVLYGTPVAPATAGVLIYHTIAFWIPSLGGALAYAMVTVAGRAPRPQAPVSRGCEGRSHQPQLVPSPAGTSR
jgi:uncharacterized membrane protein YbhN (UPF0104 family)